MSPIILQTCKTDDCADEFCNLFFSKENAESTVFAQNQSGDDAKCLFFWCTSHDILPSKYIQQGSGTTYMHFSKYN